MAEQKVVVTIYERKEKAVTTVFYITFRLQQ